MSKEYYYIEDEESDFWNICKSLFNWGFYIVIIFLFIWGIYYDYDNPLDYIGEDPAKIKISGRQNLNFLHFSKLPITYSFDEFNSCYDKKLDQVRESFNILEEETDGIMKFNEVESDGNIIISCMPYQDLYGGAAGYGGPEFYEGYREILNGFVKLYEIGDEYVDCESYPTTALHETLHVLGFDHINDKKSIMYAGYEEEYVEYEWEYCQRIDNKIVGCLKNIYSNGKNGTSCEGLPYLY